MNLKAHVHPGRVCRRSPEMGFLGKPQQLQRGALTSPCGIYLCSRSLWQNFKSPVRKVNDVIQMSHPWPLTELVARVRPSNGGLARVRRGHR